MKKITKNFYIRKSTWAQIILLASVFGIIEIWRFPMAYSTGDFWLSIIAYATLMIFIGFPILIIELLLHKKKHFDKIDYEEKLLGRRKWYAFSVLTAKALFAIFVSALLVLFIGTTVVSTLSTASDTVINTEFFLNDSLTSFALMSVDFFTLIIIMVIGAALYATLGHPIILRWSRKIRIFTFIALLATGLIIVARLLFDFQIPDSMLMIENVDANQIFASGNSTSIWVFAFIQTLLTVNILYSGFDFDVFDQEPNVNIVFSAGMIIVFVIIISILTLFFFDYVTACYGVLAATSAISTIGYEGTTYAFGLMASLSALYPILGAVFNILLTILIIEFVYGYLYDFENYLIEKFDLKKEKHVRPILVTFIIIMLILLSSGDSLVGYLEQFDVILLGLIVTIVTVIKYFNVMWHEAFEQALDKELKIYSYSDRITILVIVMAKYVLNILTFLFLIQIFIKYSWLVFVPAAVCFVVGYIVFGMIYNHVNKKELS